MNVLIKWAKKKLALEASEIEKMHETPEGSENDDKKHKDAEEEDVEKKEEKN